MRAWGGRILWTAVAALALTATASGRQAPLFTDAFPPEEFAARRAKVLAEIGDAVAVLQGATEYPAYVAFRQNNQFFYLTGVEVPRALALLDGRTGTTTLFVQPRNERLEQFEGPVLVPGDEAARLTGITSVRARDDFAAAFAAAAQGGRTVYTPLRAESLGAGTPSAASDHAQATAADPWDGRPSRETQFVARLKAHAPGIEVRDLDPILDRLRLIKTPREIALLREATRLSGLGLMEGIRNAHPGMREHEISAIADYVFARGGSQGIAYFPLVATATNAYWPHYHAGTGELKAGDLVLFDYAPDYKYYSADVTRMFPASGTFSPPQRELYTIYLRLYQALMTSIRPNAAPRDIIRDAVVKMDAIVTQFAFASDKHRLAAQAFVDRFRGNTGNTLGHTVGMEVHDVYPPTDVLKPGMVFTIEPALTIDEDRTYIRLEDMILVTDSGYENLSAFAPVEPDAIERLMAEVGCFEERKASDSSPAGVPSPHLPRSPRRRVAR
jgi:Xaa-Pro aminopeptidase